MDLPYVDDKVAQRIRVVLDYLYPIATLFFFLFCFTFRSILLSKPDPSASPTPPIVYGPGGKPLPQKLRKQDDKAKVAELDFTRPRKLLFNWLSVAVAMSFLASSANVIVHALVARKEGWWCGKSVVFYLVGSFFVYCLLLISLIDSKPSPTSAHLATWLLALAMELMILGASLAVYSKPHKEPSAKPGLLTLADGGKLRHHMTKWEIVEAIIAIVRIFLLALLVSFYLIFVITRNYKAREAKAAAAARDSDEATGLLAEHHGENGSAHVQSNGYGTHSQQRPLLPEPAAAPPGWERPTTAPSRSWWEYIKGYSTFFPYLWPSKDRKLQIVVIICLILVILQRVLNMLVPDQVGVITDLLAAQKGPIKMPWGQICLFVLYKILQGSNGLLGAARGILWIPISQYSYRALSVAAFEHVHGLSLDFHLGKKTGEVLSALGKGSSINTFLEQVTFQVIPMLIDLGVAIGYFLVKYDSYYALVIAIVTFWYVYITIRMAQWRAEMRRQMVNADREEDAVKNDSMISYETVKYFNAEGYEFNRYREAVNKFQRAEYKVNLSLNYMNVSQNMIFMLGLLATCFICAYQITIGERNVGKFNTLLIYMAQLQQPLNFFGTFYRLIQSSMINSERMLELFKEKPTVVDGPDAVPMPSCEGGIDFDNVEFAYDPRKPALRGLTFHCAPGTTTALVGESGGGKSTVFRLLFRFYDQESGRIQVDGHDVQDVTIDSLRKQIGVVPQDTILFNETLMYNLKYANQDATDEDVYAACRAASIHDKILGFPDGYNTKVGERGLRLSGGEKQRVAIARTILKNPRIILLDEATAALDTETEQHIQDALTTLGQGRTMLVIAHRLSTITLADQILVLHEGRVEESGEHDELLARKGRYANMWRKQVRAQKAAEEAKALKDRAERLRKEIGQAEGLESASQSEDEAERSIERTRHQPHHHSNLSLGGNTDEVSEAKPPGHP